MLQSGCRLPRVKSSNVVTLRIGSVEQAASTAKTKDEKALAIRTLVWRLRRATVAVMTVCTRRHRRTKTQATMMVPRLDWLCGGSSWGDGVGLMRGLHVSTLPSVSPAFSIAFLFAVDSAKPRVLDRP